MNPSDLGLTLPDWSQGLPVHFLWGEALWALALLPLLVAVYLWLLRRRRQAVLTVPQLALLRAAAQGQRHWRRHLPPALLLLGLACLIVASARPVARLQLPSRQQTLLLAMDVSGSMRATDVQPNRLVAAQAAAKAFVLGLPREVRVGVISFAGTAAVVQAPTPNRDEVLAAIDRFQLQRGTAIGSGLVLSLATLFPEAGIDLSQITGQQRMPEDTPENPARKPPHTPVAPGSYDSAAVILLTDGQRTTGPDPMEAAQMAAERGVRVYTVGIGTREGEVIGFEGWSMRVKLDEDTLKQIATATRGQYFYAGTAEDLKQVYQGLSSRLVVETRETEVSALAAAAGALLTLLAAGLSLWWFGRIG